MKEKYSKIPKEHKPEESDGAGKREVEVGALENVALTGDGCLVRGLSLIISPACTACR